MKTISALSQPTEEVPVLLPAEFRYYAQDSACVGLPQGRPWRSILPLW